MSNTAFQGAPSLPVILSLSAEALNEVKGKNLACSGQAPAKQSRWGGSPPVIARLVPSAAREPDVAIAVGRPVND